MNVRDLIALALTGLLLGCGRPDLPGLPTSTTQPAQAVPPLATLTARLDPPTGQTDTPPPGPLGGVAATHTATPDPYWPYTVEHLRTRSYGGGELEIVELLVETSYFVRYLVRFPSDGLTIYGFVNVPQKIGPLAVIIALHGYIDPGIYQTLDYTTGYADALARAGYLVIHPNLRNYPPSDSGENLFRVGMAIDVLNLIAIIKSQAGLLEIQSGQNLLLDADPDRLGLWGHSMGGGITTRVVTVSPDVKAAVLYAAMSGDERQNFEAISHWSDGLRGQEELAVPVKELGRIDPQNFFAQITARIAIHHGRADELVPLAWSIHTCDTLRELSLPVECTYHQGMPHTFFGDGDLLFVQAVQNFFDRFLSPD